jgi:hypothetical protein
MKPWSKPFSSCAIFYVCVKQSSASSSEQSTPIIVKVFSVVEVAPFDPIPKTYCINTQRINSFGTEGGTGEHYTIETSVLIARIRASLLQYNSTITTNYLLNHIWHLLYPK